MAVVGIPGWIGESAAQETGQRWMYQAREALRLPGPGWMSDMAGQSVYNITVTIAERWYNNTRYRGAWRHGAKNWGNVDHKGSVSGTFAGGIGTFGVMQNNTHAFSLTVVDGPAKQLRVQMDDGAVFFFENSGEFSGSYRQYISTDIRGLYDYFNARVGQTRMGLIT